MRAKILSIIAIFVFAFASKAQAQDWHFGYNYSRFAPLGFTIGYMPKSVGCYFSGKYGLGLTDGDTEYYSIDTQCGVGGYEEDWYNRKSYTGGIILRIYNNIALYGGVGYGTYGEAWSEEDAERAAVVINRFAGPEFEVGLMYRGDSYFLGLGGIVMNGTNVKSKAILCDISIQIGMVF
ncbi:MAG: hypothetical protein SNH35_04210 [Rikenellaceae bacterium]